MLAEIYAKDGAWQTSVHRLETALKYARAQGAKLTT